MKNDLVLTIGGEESLSKQQKEFNRLVIKIESLRADIDDTTKVLDTNLEYHNRHIFPMELEIFSLKREVLKLLFPHYKDKNALSQNQRKSMLGILKGLLQEVINNSESKPDEDVQEIFETIEGMSYEDAEMMDFESMKDNIEETLRRNNVYADLGDMHKDMGPDEMARKIEELNDLIRRERDKKQQQKTNKKKSKKQAEKIEQEKLIDEVRSKNISSIYKQLVKILHPDLEQDDALRPMKEELMKQLSIAYKNNDLHALLKLELEWVTRSTTDTKKLTDDKLNIYNEVLKEQVQELEQEMNQLIHNPRYSVLARFVLFIKRINKKDLERVKMAKEDTLLSLQLSQERLKSGSPMGEIKRIIQIFKQQNDYERY